MLLNYCSCLNFKVCVCGGVCVSGGGDDDDDDWVQFSLCGH